MATQTRPLYEIANEIRKDWKAQTKNGKIPAPALAYLDPMSTLDSINDRYIFEGAKEIVIRFLCSAGTWKGETAKRVKAELKAMAGIK
jgi:hypothetical protein